ncbi:hypothetical protein HPP92_006457 [Vanilla planifolia]|uniref:EF-hand domain-containing protein n=1 Tax=Vanilla planifolia TaxID=51239 RepID=A0A835V6T1_VANPL|nr:hypothetical protein HPP92_006457 [Vanilla planifolia]
MKLTRMRSFLSKISKSKKRSRIESPSFGSSTTCSSSDGITPKSVLRQRNSWTGEGVTVVDLFSVFDRDGDGKITKRELETVLRKLGPLDPPTEEELASMVDEIDRDGDGCISLDELSAIGLAALGLPSVGEELREVFTVFDADGDGKISAEDLLRVFIALGDGGCTIDDCRRMIVGVDSDGDGLVCFGDFAVMMDGLTEIPCTKPDGACRVAEGNKCRKLFVVIFLPELSKEQVWKLFISKQPSDLSSSSSLVLYPMMDLTALGYQKFVHFALEEAQLRAKLTRLPLPDNLNISRSKDEKATLHAISFKARKVRHLRSLLIEGSPAMQVLDFAAFPEPKFDLPIFCANFFTTPTLSIIVLDLNPLHDVTIQREYKEKYYKNLMPLYQKYAELLPWGEKITSESLRFFSPIVIWCKFSSSLSQHQVLFGAFKEYFKAWLDLTKQAMEEEDESQTLRNCEAQHKYLTWRAEKDPGHHLLERLLGDDLAKQMMRQFLFEGVDSLGSKSFLDYFPEYRCEDGSINQKRSVLGKAYKTRPWDAAGEFVGDVATGRGKLG